jgi:integrase/recombinase XerC
MPLLDLEKLIGGLPRAWSGLLRDWDRTMRSVNHPESTRYNYLLAATQLSRYLDEHASDEAQLMGPPIRAR